MTNDMPETSSSPSAATRRIPLAIGAVVAGALIAFAGVYGYGSFRRSPGGDSACAGAVELARKIAPLAHVEVVAINIDTRDADKPRNFLKDANLTRLGYFSDQKAKVFQDLKNIGKSLGMPTSVLVDGQGCEIANLAGPVEWASDDAVKLIKAAMQP